MYFADYGDIYGATPIGSTGLGDGLGFFFPGMEQLISKVMAPKEEKKKGTGFTFCPPGMVPNPQWAAIPEEDRSQAAAAGVQACLPGPDKDKRLGKRPQCYFTIGARKFKCDQGEFQRAYSIARKRAMKRPSGKASVTLQVGGRTIIIPVRAGAAAAGAAQPGQAVPGAPAGVIAATPGPGGAFSCPQGLAIARDQAGRVVCAPPDVAQQARQEALSRRRGRVRGRRGRDRGRRRGRLRDGLGFVPYWPPNYQTMMFRQLQYQQTLAPHPGAASRVMPGFRAPAIPQWMAQSLPPNRMTLSGAFGAF